MNTFTDYNSQRDTEKGFNQEARPDWRLINDTDRREAQEHLNALIEKTKQELE